MPDSSSIPPFARMQTNTTSGPLTAVASSDLPPRNTAAHLESGTAYETSSHNASVPCGAGNLATIGLQPPSPRQINHEASSAVPHIFTQTAPQESAVNYTARALLALPQRGWTTNYPPANFEEICNKAKSVAALLGRDYNVRRFESEDDQWRKLAGIFSAACCFMCSVPDTESLGDSIDDDPDSLPGPYLVDAIRCYNGGKSIKIALFMPSMDRLRVCCSGNNPSHRQECLGVLRDVQQATRKFNHVCSVPISTTLALTWTWGVFLSKRIDRFYTSDVPVFASKSEPQEKSAEPKEDETELLQRISNASGKMLLHEEHIKLRDLFSYFFLTSAEISDILQMVSQLSASLLPVVDLVRLFLQTDHAWSALAPVASQIQQKLGHDPNETAIQLRQLIKLGPNAYQMQFDSLLNAQREVMARYKEYDTDSLLEELCGDVQNETDKDWLRVKVTELQQISTAAAVEFLQLCRPLYDQLDYDTAFGQMSELYVLPAEHRLTYRNEFIQNKIQKNSEDIMATCWQGQTSKAFEIMKHQLATLEAAPSGSKPPLDVSAEVRKHLAALFPGINVHDVPKILHDASAPTATEYLEFHSHRQSDAIGTLTAEFDPNVPEFEKRAGALQLANAWRALLGSYYEERDETPAFLHSDCNLPIIATVSRLIFAYPQFAKSSPFLTLLSEQEVEDEQREMVHSFLMAASQCIDETRQGRVCGVRQQHQFCRVLQGSWRFFEEVLDDCTPMQRFINLTDQFATYIAPNDPAQSEVEELYAALTEKQMPPAVTQWYRDNLHRLCVQLGWPLPESLRDHVRRRVM